MAAPLRPEQIASSLARGLQSLYTVHGDEPLLAQEAADAVRAAARDAGYTDRTVFTVAGAHFDWSAVLAAAQSMSLFGDRQLIEIRIPSGKPGKDGADALQRYVALVGGGAATETVTIVQLPRLDWQQQKSAWFAALDAAGTTVRVETPERSQLPAWLAQRLARQDQRVRPGDEGTRTLAFFADRTEGNLLAAHQELQKLALLHGPGELGFDDIEAAVVDVARFDIARLGEAVWGGQVGRALRVLDALQAEGESAVMVHWNLADDLRTLARARAALDGGRPLPLALKEARAWGAKERLFERVLPQLEAAELARLVGAASICDGICKGLKHPQWPLDPYAALRRLVLAMLQQTVARGRRPAPRLALN